MSNYSAGTVVLPLHKAEPRQRENSHFALLWDTYYDGPPIPSIGGLVRKEKYGDI